MDTSEIMKRIRVRESIESHCGSCIDEKIDRLLEDEHQGIIGGTILLLHPLNALTFIVPAISLELL